MSQEIKNSSRNLLNKVVALTVALYMLVGNASVLGVGIGQVIAEDEKIPQVKLRYEESEYTSYDNQAGKGAVVRTKLHVSEEIASQQDYKAVNKVNLEVTAPRVNNQLPAKAVVVNSNTQLTTGQDNTNVNQNYDSNSGLLTMSYENKDYSEYKENAEDVFEILYLYSENVLTEETPNLNTSSQVRVKIEYKENKKSIERAETFQLTWKEKEGQLVVVDVAEVSDIYKGFFYANEQYGTKYETTYIEKEKVAVRNSDLVDKLEIVQEASKYVQGKNEVEANIQVKSTTIASSTFYNMFGIDGYIDVFVNNEKYATMKYTDPDKKGNRKYIVEYVATGEQKENEGRVEYPENVRTIQLVTSNPLKEANLEMTTEKKIMADEPVKVSSMQAVKEVKQITGSKQVTNKVQTTNEAGEAVEEERQEEAKIATTKTEKTIELKEPTTQMSVALSNYSVSTITENKLTATIKLNDTNNSCKLIEAGTLEMALPANLTNAKITNAKIVYGNGINANATMKNGKVMVTLTGKQTSYDVENISGGVNIVLDLAFTLDNTVPSHKETLTTTYGSAKVSTDINVVSKAGLFMVNTVENNKGARVTSMDNTDKEITLDMKQKGQTVTQTISLVNNYDRDLTNVQLTGTLGDKDAENKANFPMALAKAIKVTGAKAEVYYANNTNGEGWTKDLVKDAKAYKVVITDAVKAQSNVAVILPLAVADNLSYNAVNYLNTKVNYAFGTAKLEQTSAMKLATAEKKETSVLTASAENQQKLSVAENNNLKVSTLVTAGEQAVGENEAVYAGQILRYTVTIENEGKTAVKNLRFNSQIENAAYYELQDTGIVYTIDEKGQEKTGTQYMIAEANDTTRNSSPFVLNAGEKKTFEYQVVVNDNATSVKSKVAFLNADTKTTVVSKETTNEVKQAKLKTELRYSYNEESPIYSNSQTSINLRLISYGKDLQNIKSVVTLPEELDLDEYQTYGVDANITVEENEAGNIVCSIDKMNANSEVNIVFLCNTKSIDKSLDATKIKISSVTTVEGENYSSNTLIKEMKQSESGVTMNITKNFGDGELFTANKDLEYAITLKNNGTLNLEDVGVIVGLDDGLTVKKLSINGKEQTITDNTGIDTSIALGAGQQAEVKAVLALDMDAAEKNDLEVATSVYTGYTENLANTSVVKINKYQDMTANDESAQVNADQGMNKISGTAWLDANKDGKRDDGEAVQKGIKVTLINADNGDIVKDGDKEMTATTDNNGNYEFNNVANGTYIVMFEVDTNKYTLTTYQKNGVSESLNSDAIMTDITVNGEVKRAGVTDNLEIKDNAMTHIDIGLVEGATFDLSLNKQIASITIVNEQGTQTKEYKNKNIAKVDLVAKYMNNTNVIITYKFIVKNEGEVTGYVNKLVDNLPSGLEFNSELNKDWYKGSDGKLYNTSLSENAIEPGKTSEVELVLTKRTTENSTGTFTNSAELQEISNIEAIEEKANAKENNKSSADVVISIKTGSAIMYIGITLGSIALIAAGAYMIKNKVLNKGI